MYKHMTKLLLEKAENVAGFALLAVTETKLDERKYS